MSEKINEEQRVEISPTDFFYPNFFSAVIEFLSDKDPSDSHVEKMLSWCNKLEKEIAIKHPIYVHTILAPLMTKDKIAALNSRIRTHDKQTSFLASRDEFFLLTAFIINFYCNFIELKADGREIKIKWKDGYKTELNEIEGHMWNFFSNYATSFSFNDNETLLFIRELLNDPERMGNDLNIYLKLKSI